MSDKDTIAHIEALDAKRTQCILARDFAGLEPLIAEDLRYVHSSSVLENKAQYLAKLTSGHYTYRAMTSLHREMRVIDDVVLVNGDVRIDLLLQGNQMHPKHALEDLNTILNRRIRLVLVRHRLRGKAPPCPAAKAPRP